MIDDEILEMDDDSPEEEAPAWLTSYSDMITDLLAIFVILFSFAMMFHASTAAAAKAKENQAAIVATQEVQQDDEQDISLPPERFNNFYEELKSYIAKNGLSDQLSVSKVGNDVVLLRMADSALFEPAQAEINPESEQVLASVSAILTEYGDFIEMVRIEGHTDNRPINNRKYSTNWELSTARAVNVLKRLLEISSLGSQKFSAVGYSEYYPIADNETEAGRAQNRRVDFVIETSGE